MNRCRLYFITLTAALLILGFSEKRIFAEDTNASANPSEKSDDYFLKAGEALITNEAIGSLKYGLTGKEVLALLGEPSEKSKLEVMGYDGNKHQTWYYKTQGIDLEMVGDTEQRIETLEIRGPCTLKTSRSIGLGSSKEEVLTSYKNEIDLSDPDADSDVLIAGTIYGGLFFKIEDNRVTSIFVGAGAE